MITVRICSFKVSWWFSW